MTADTCGIIVYTHSGVIPFEVVVTTDNFQEKVAAALEEGTVLLNLADGGQLILCAINVVAIEVCDIDNLSKLTADNPPLAKF